MVWGRKTKKIEVELPRGCYSRGTTTTACEKQRAKSWALQCQVTEEAIEILHLHHCSDGSD